MSTAGQAYLKKGEVGLDLLTEVDMQLIVEKSIIIKVLIKKMTKIKIKLITLPTISCNLLITDFGCIL